MYYENEPVKINPAYAHCKRLQHGWLYIAIDMRDLTYTKIGLTTKEAPKSRIAEGRTYNPFLTLFATYELARCTHGISREELHDIEGYIHARSAFGAARRHINSGRDSEWFVIPPNHAESMVDALLAKRGFSVDHEYLNADFDGPNNWYGINIRAMRKIKKINRPTVREMQTLVKDAGYDSRLINPYLVYLAEFHKDRHPDRVWL